MKKGKDNCCPFCGADEEKYLANACCKDARDEYEYQKWKEYGDEK